jgi:hypothetical protein
LLSCQNEQAQSEQSEEPLTEEITAVPEATEPATSSDQLLAKAVEAHGGEGYDTAHYGFTFRKKAYTFKNDDNRFLYTVTSEKDEKKIVDRLENGQLTRTIDGEQVELTEKQNASATEALNSVIYFATLPHKLLDPAVNLERQTAVSIKDNSYDVLKVNFDEAGGGTDHDDNFRYWINQKTDRIDYLAYDYRTSGGGVRFRSAYNPRIVGGILFQDYVNYKADVGTSLDDLPALYEQGQLKELSRIETEEVVAL